MVTKNITGIRFVVDDPQIVLDSLAILDCHPCFCAIAPALLSAGMVLSENLIDISQVPVRCQEMLMEADISTKHAILVAGLRVPPGFSGHSEIEKVAAAVAKKDESILENQEPILVHYDNRGRAARLYGNPVSDCILITTNRIIGLNRRGANACDFADIVKVERLAKKGVLQSDTVQLNKYDGTVVTIDVCTSDVCSFICAAISDIIQGGLTVLSLAALIDSSVSALPYFSALTPTGRWLHGRLEINIRFASLSDGSTLKQSNDRLYVTVHLGESKLLRTATVTHKEAFVWNSSCNKYICHRAESLVFKLKDEQWTGTRMIGAVKVPVDHILEAGFISGKFPVLPVARGAQQCSKTMLDVVVRFYPAVEHKDISPDVPSVYFPVRAGNSVILYHDAKVHPCKQREVTLGSGDVYRDMSTWDSLYDKIVQAKEFIWITGWAVYTEISLKRPFKDYPTIGEMLLQKAEEGLQVVIMVWDDNTSTSYKAGVMGTHDEELVQYFKDSKVTAVKVSRQGYDKNKGVVKTFINNRQGNLLFTHHQKTVMLDTDCEDCSTERKLVAFIGGLDLCDGRYDTPDHPLWVGKNIIYPEWDYHPPGVGDKSMTWKMGARQPWHDIHAEVAGPGALDICTNFIERWKLQGAKECANKICLVDPSKVCQRVDVSPNHESFNVQLFRSIDSWGAEFSRNTSVLINTEGRKVDMSIHEAYVHHIRRAKNFIYIENQYFLGSSHNWYDSSIFNL